MHNMNKADTNTWPCDHYIQVGQPLSIKLDHNCPSDWKLYDLYLFFWQLTIYSLGVHENKQHFQSINL